MSARVNPPTFADALGVGFMWGVNTRESEVLTAAVTIQVNIFVFGLIGLIALLRIPSLVGFLKSNMGRPILQTFARGAGSAEWKIRAKRALGDVSNPRIEKIVFPNSAQLAAARVSNIKCPPRIPAAPTFLGPLARLLRSRAIVPGYSALQLGILMNYTYVLLYGAFRLSNPFTDDRRSAWLAISQLPLIFGLAQKSNILGSLLGYGYETLNYIHRYAGRLAVLAANIHGLYWIYMWTNLSIFREMISIRKNIWGLVLLILMDILCFFSTSYWRKKAYNLFYWSHTFSILAIMPAACLHQPAVRPYIYTCAGLYGIDRILRLAKSRISTATIAHLSQMDMAYVEIPYLHSGWRAGQHVRLRVLSMGMGKFGWAESHPFTIASASGGNDGLVLLCKRSGDWTGKLVDLAKKLDGEFEGNQGEIRIWVEGPYGGPSRMVFAGFSAVVLAVAGSGITFGLSMMEELLARDRSNDSRLKYIELVWVVREAASVKPLVQLFTSLMQQTETTILRISIHYTRALTEKVSVYGRVEAAPYVPVSIVHPHLTLTPGRPKFKNVLNNAIDNALSVGPGKSALGVSGVAVGVCGPTSLGEEIVKSVGEIDAATRFRVGGVEIHEETFGW